MSAAIITKAFEQWKAQQAASGQVVVLDEFVFANVPDLDVTASIDPTAGLPDAAHIVYRQAVGKTGLVNENAVVYSVTLGADVGDFSFNWIGLVSKAAGTLAMVVHAPVQSKVKNANGQQGNVLTRSFLMEYNGAETQTLISTPAETWQIDFTARLAGMDETVRLANADVYGAGAFFDSGFLVSKTGNQYFVTAGIGYIGGLRAALTANTNITVTNKPMKVWADVSYHGTLTSAYQTDIKFTVATELANYTQTGIAHYVYALASIDANGVITDLRPKGSSQYLRRDKNLVDIADPALALNNLSGVPTSRKINKKTLTEDIVLSPEDVGAVPLSSDGAVEDVKKIRGISSIFTPQSTSPLELGHLGAAGDFYLDIHTDGTELGEDYSHRIHFQLGGDITFQSFGGGAVKIGSAGSIHAAGDLSTENSFLADGSVTAKGDIRSESNITSVGIINAGNGLYDTPGVRAYSPNYRPTPDAINAIARDTCSVAGFANGRVDSPYFRHAETSEVIDLARYTWVNERIAQSQDWAKTELRNDIYAYGDNRYIYDVQRGSQALENAGWNAQQVWEAPTGCFMTGLNIRTDLGDCRMMGKYYRALMVKTVGGSWRQVGN